jgi:outer membrane biosynthesis protein TonB
MLANIGLSCVERTYYLFTKMNGRQTPDTRMSRGSRSRTAAVVLFVLAVSTNPRAAAFTTGPPTFRSAQHVSSSLHMIPEEVVMPVVIFAGALAATVYSSKGEPASELSEQVTQLTEQIQTLTKVQSTTEAAATEPESITAPPPAPAPKAVAKTVEPKKDLALVVGSTIDEIRATEKRVQDKKKLLSKESVVAVVAPPAVTTATESESTTTTEKKRGFLRQSWRVIKKVVAPWRKWENIS